MLYNSIIKQLYEKIKCLREIFMKLCGIISEFNPLTNGHEYIISEAKKRTGLNVICIMSGNLVQRGDFACLDKYTRSALAIKAGAVGVVELPLVYALSSASYFAEGAVKCLMKMNCISHLAFGVELDNIDDLEKLARLKVKESQTTKNLVTSYVRKGDNYSVAMYKAYTQTFGANLNVEKIFSSANNILALEYLTAIYKLGADITPVYIKRTDNGHSSNKIVKTIIEGKKIYYASASVVRKAIENEDLKTLKKIVPATTLEAIHSLNAKAVETANENFSCLMLSSIRDKSPEDLCGYYNFNQSLAHLTHDSAKTSQTLTELVHSVTHKSFRESRVKKLMTYPYLGLTQELADKIMENPRAINVLAIKGNFRKHFALIKKQSKIKLVISHIDYLSLTKPEKLNIDLNQRGTNLFNLLYKKVYSKDKCIFID